MIFTTPPLPIIDLPAAPTHYARGRGGFQPQYIVIHHTGVRDSRLWLSRTSRPAVSTHRLITRYGANIKIVADEDTAFCAGFAEVGPIDPDTNDPPGVPSNFNPASLNLELENTGDGSEPYLPVQLEMAAAQVVEWWGKFGFLALVGHGWVDARKHDPFKFPWQDFYRRIDARYCAVRGITVFP